MEFFGQSIHWTSLVWIPYDKLHLFNSKSLQYDQVQGLNLGRQEFFTVSFSLKNFVNLGFYDKEHFVISYFYDRYATQF